MFPFLIKTLSFILAYLPYPVIRILGSALGRCVRILDAKHRAVVMENLDTAYGQEKSPAQKQALARKIFENLGMTAVEFIRLGWRRKNDFKDFVVLEGANNVELAKKKGKGVVLISAHFGNWELMGLTLAEKIGQIGVVARKQKHGAFDGFVNSVRTGSRTRPGNIVIDKKNAMRKLLRTLSDNGVLCILMDQNVTRSEGVFVDFFGHRACTNKGPAALASRCGAVVLPVCIIRERTRHRVIIGPALDISRSGDKRADTLENTALFSSAIETMIRAHPELWFWVHRRWKTRPENEDDI